MNVYRLIGLALLLIIAVSSLHAEPLDSRKLTGARFLGWVNLQDVCTDTAINQVWRQRLYEIPRNMDGYTMVSYMVGHTETSKEAVQIVKERLHQRRFNDYIAKGYKVTNEPWVVRDFQCMKFVVRGTDLTDDNNVCHRAEMYTFAVPVENWFIWLEVRQVISGPDLPSLDRTMAKTGGQRMAEDLVNVVYSLWNPGENPQPPAPIEPPTPGEVTPPTPDVVTPPIAPPTPDVVQPPVALPKPDEVTPPVAPPKPDEVKPPVAPPKPDEVKPPVAPPTPDEVKPPVAPPTPDEVKPPVAPPKPDATTPPAAPLPPVAPPKPVEPTKPVEPPKPVEPATSALPAGTKAWTTPDGFLTLVIPQAWGVSGKTVFTVSGPAGAGVRILPPETYASADELSRALQDFTETQQEISEKNFASKAFSVGGATGVEVHYNAVHGHGMHLYYFGKSGRLWRLEIDTNDAKPLTAELAQMVSLLTVK